MRIWPRLALVPLVAALVLAGIWAAGGLLTDNFRLAMVLTALWLGLVGAAALGIAWRWRVLALPVLGTALVTAAVAGGYLLYASSVDRVVREQVAVAASAGNVAVGRGAFGSRAQDDRHRDPEPARGRRHVLTLGARDGSRTGSPRLPRHRRAGRARRRRRAGRAQGQPGDQKYDVPASVDTDRHRTVVIWCRAFSVAFGSARLA